MTAAIMVFTMATSCAFAKGERPFFLRGVRALGMGGAQMGLSEDQNAFFYNPAGVTKRKESMLTIAEVRASVSQDMLKTIDWVKVNQSDLEKFAEIPYERQVKLGNDIINTISRYRNNFSVSVLNPNYISGPIGEEGSESFIGVGVFDNVDANVQIKEPSPLPMFDLDTNVDAAAMFLLASKITHQVSLGLNIKGLVRGSIQEKNMSILEMENYKPIVQPGFGIGADLGVSWDPLSNVSAAFGVTDIGATVINYKAVTENGETKPEKTGIIYPRMNVGVAYKPLKHLLDVPFFPDITLALDVRDIMNEGGTGDMGLAEMLKNTHAGVEFGWRMLYVRGGFNSGYPTAGVGVSLACFKFDYAYYTDELGVFPGDIPSSNHMVSFSWRFGTTLNIDTEETVS